jgi:hypothetical protein
MISYFIILLTFSFSFSKYNDNLIEVLKQEVEKLYYKEPSDYDYLIYKLKSESELINSNVKISDIQKFSEEHQFVSNITEKLIEFSKSEDGKIQTFYYHKKTSSSSLLQIIFTGYKKNDELVLYILQSKSKGVIHINREHCWYIFWIVKKCKKNEAPFLDDDEVKLVNKVLGYYGYNSLKDKIKDF